MHGVEAIANPQVMESQDQLVGITTKSPVPTLIFGWDDELCCRARR